MSNDRADAMSSQPPPSRYPPSMGPGGRTVEERRRETMEERIARRRQLKYEKTAEGLRLSWPSQVTGGRQEFVVPYSSFSWPGMLTSTGLYTAITSSTVLDVLMDTERISGIPHTQESAEAYSSHISKLLVWRQCGNILFTGVGAWSWYNTRNEMKFPFRTVKPAEKYEKFPNRFIPIIRGPMARSMWQATRLGMCILPWIMFVKPFTATAIGMSAMRNGLAQDDRARPYQEAIKQQNKLAMSRRQESNRSAQGGVRQGPGAALPPQSPPEERADGSYPTNDTYGGQITDSMQDGYTETDANYSDMPADRESVLAQVKQSVQEVEKIGGELRRRTEAVRRGQPRTPPYDPAQQDRQPSDDPFAFNEDPLSTAASDPDSPQYNPNASRQSSQARPPRRSWEDIRRGAAGTNASAQGQNSPYSNAAASPESGSFAGAESYGSQSASSQERRSPQASESYGGGGGGGGGGRREQYDADRQKERDQREFDAMLDRERRLGQQGEENGGGGGARKGGRW